MLGRRLAGPLAIGRFPAAQAETWRRHVFDLLGSGPVRVAYGEGFSGFGRWRYGPGPALESDWRSALAAQAWPANQARARAILALIDDPAYRPIDWQVDFKSGYRWSARWWGPAVPYGHLPGVDIKVPWELARLQHLPRLALAFASSGEAIWAKEARHQILDFLAVNPPGWGVNWACAMDVAIRAANLLLTRELLLAHGWREDDGFAAELSAGLLAHGRFIAARLEWSPRHRGNHYLADLCGLAWVAAFLPRSPETDAWLAFATQELSAEIPRQFLADGANFEASTAYHRLSAEMAAYTAALLVGLPEDKRRALAEYDHRRWRHTPALAPAPCPPLPAIVFERLAGAARFAADVTKPSGEMVQIGDNDSGRFFDLDDAPGPLDTSRLIAAIGGLVDLDGSSQTVEAAVVAALAGPDWRRPRFPARTVAVAADDSAQPHGTPSRLTVVPPDPAALEGLLAIAYPDFGLYLWKGPRAFVALRCGPIGQNGNGGHAHNDQLAVEIEIDGIAFARDPGSFVYTPDPAARNAYRSVSAHVAPRRGDMEPARLLAPFRLEDRAQARVVRFGDDVLGCHAGFGDPVWRRVAIEGGAVVIEDWPGDGGETIIRRPEDLARTLGLDLPFSPAYGVR